MTLQLSDRDRELLDQGLQISIASSSFSFGNTKPEDEIDKPHTYPGNEGKGWWQCCDMTVQHPHWTTWEHLFHRKKNPPEVAMCKICAHTACGKCVVNSVEVDQQPDGTWVYRDSGRRIDAGYGARL